MTDTNQHQTTKHPSSYDLALERTNLAEIRSDLARNRTLQAAERTYAAWIRTGFSMAGVGWSLGGLLRDSTDRSLALLLGGGLILLGILCFIYAWFGFRQVYRYINHIHRQDKDEEDFLGHLNLITVTILTVSLVIIFIIGYTYLLF
ncbi:DUF202 domain-containing protein [Facklamia sp. DSM 111018]|uniref:DUF202 domain-containing protein n=1 Tax=Facklamia lactis TaxID=2749967 RepID=A0ABS0LPY0_9LACT|nr:DUF202 domain-containing protein [Facklamia lactis]MBG9979894.1 DUF202 domain-containing protein [Facklamia lactis]MBG9985426.1 DUF202 domain-containing protein [Facklamia lactis]